MMHDHMTIMIREGHIGARVGDATMSEPGTSISVLRRVLDWGIRHRAFSFEVLQPTTRVWHLIYDDAEGGGNRYHRIFATEGLAHQALNDIVATIWKSHDFGTPGDMEKAEVMGDYVSQANYFYLVDAAEISVNAMTVETES